MTETRGIRNHNPGNLDKGQKWQGLATKQPDKRFATFKAPVWGIRAMVKTLDTYQRDHGLWTIRGIINRWAPPVENDTGAYVNAVAAECKAKPDETFALNIGQNTLRIVKAIIHHENGQQPYDDATILEAIHLARSS